MTNWTPQDLDVLGGTEEIEITTLRPDGSARAWTPIWLVRAGDGLFVRSYRGAAGAWYRHARQGDPTRIRARGREHDVAVAAPDTDTTSPIDEAYRAKYARYGDTYLSPMVTPAAQAATLRLTPRDQ
jgi:hypothetical protein